MVAIVSLAVIYRNRDQRDDCAKQISDKPRAHKHCNLQDKSGVKIVSSECFRHVRSPSYGIATFV